MSDQISGSRSCDSFLSNSLLLLNGIRLECPIPQLIIDREHRVVFWNRALEIYTGIKAEGIVGTTDQWRAFYEERRPIMADILVDEALDELQRWYPGKYSKSRLIEGAYEATDYFPHMGGGVWLYFTAAPIRDGDGHIQGAIETLEDVTERKRAEASLRRSENLLAEGERIAKWGTWDWDLERDKLLCSRGLELILGLLHGCPLSLSYIEDNVVCQGYKEVFRENVKQAIEEDVPLDSDLCVQKQDGSEEIRVIHVRGMVKKDKNGRPKRMVGTVLDITERKEAEEALKKSKTEAELYLDLMGHDIRNLNQVSLGYIELSMGSLEKKCAVGDEDKVMLGKAVEALQNSSRLIDNIRKIRASISGEAKLYPVDLGKLLSEAVAHHSQVPGRSITINYTPPANCFVLANELLFDVFSNIIGNAIVHSQRERPLAINIEVSIACKQHEKFHKVTIEDNGPGIPDDRKKEVFGSKVSRTKGHGLGLFLVRTLVESYGGRVWVEDMVPGDNTKGARFVVMLPAVKNEGM